MMPGDLGLLSWEWSFFLGKSLYVLPRLQRQSTPVPDLLTYTAVRKSRTLHLLDWYVSI